MNIIKNTDISVVVQGPIYKMYTSACLNSVRRVLPGAYIILSTWNNTDSKGLDYDFLIESEDPGSVLQDREAGSYNNLNRQLVSTKAGLKYVKTQYCLKLRSDILLRDNRFLNYFGKFDGSSTPALHFINRVLICNFYTRNPRVFPLPYHISDWLMFGNSDDIKNLFDIELQSRQDAFWFDMHKKSTPLFSDFLPRFVPEQFLYLSFLKKYEALQIQDAYDITKENIERTETYIASDFVVLSYGKQWKIQFLKYNPNRYYEKFSLLGHWDWRVLYNHYILNEKFFLWSIYRSWSSMKRVVACARFTILKFMGIMKIKQRIKNKF